MNSKIKILVADKQDLFRASLAFMLANQEDFEIVGNAGNGKELIEILKKKHCHVAIMNGDLPVIDGKKSLDIIKRRFPEVKVIVLNDRYDQKETADFMTLGANCCLHKDCKEQTLNQAIVAVKNEDYFFDDTTSRALLNSVIRAQMNEGKRNGVTFSEREEEILKRICDGESNKEIAKSLSLSTSTIDFHKNKIYAKTNCNNSTQLLRYALKMGLITLG